MARTKLISAMLVIGPENVIYSDTDSIVFFRSKLQNLQLTGAYGEKLG